MNTLTAKPQLLKQANLSLIRRVIKTRETATRSEIVNDTKISSTTVRSLLTEMLQDGEIESIGHDESSGGRKAERYHFRQDRYYSVAFCMTDNQLHGLLINICGEIIEADNLNVSNSDFEKAIMDYIDKVIKQKEIKSIGLGVPGIVEGGCFFRKNAETEELYKTDIGGKLTAKYGIPIIMENDLNAIAIGFSRCYSKRYPSENPENIHMAYLHFERGCVSAGFISEGRIIRGFNNFAGELGLIPIEDDILLDKYLSKPMDSIKYTTALIKITSWICGILNPQYIVLGGSDLKMDCIGPISDGLSSFLPGHMLAEVLYSSDVWHDYHDGMAYLTAGKMFDEIQFSKE